MRGTRNGMFYGVFLCSTANRASLHICLGDWNFAAFCSPYLLDTVYQIWRRTLRKDFERGEKMCAGINIAYRRYLQFHQITGGIRVRHGPNGTLSFDLCFASVLMTLKMQLH